MVERVFVAAVFLLTALLVRFLGDLSDVTQHGSALAQLIWGMVYLASFMGLIAGRRRAAGLLRRSPLILIIVALALISTFWSDDPQLTLRKAIGLLGTTAFAYYVVTRFDLRDFLRVFTWTIGIAAILSLVVIIAAPEFGLMQDEYPGAWRGIFTHKNGFGTMMAIGIVTILASERRRSWAGRVGAAALLVLCSVELVGSQSVTALLAAAFCVVVTMLIVLARKGTKGRVAAIFIALVGSAACAGAFALGADLPSMLALLGRDESLTGRTDIWNAALRAIGDRPLQGFGYEAFWEPGGPYVQYDLAAGGSHVASAHNGYFEAALDFGVIGSAIALLMIARALFITCAFEASQVTRKAAWPLLAVVLFVVINLSEGDIAKSVTFVWIVFVVAVLYATAGRAAPSTLEGSSPWSPFDRISER